MMIRRWWIVSSLMVLTIVPGENFLRAETTTEEIMAEVEAKAATVNSYRADLTMTMEMMGQKMVSRGEMVFQKPNKSWMEMVMDMGAVKIKHIVISNGKTTWTYQPEMNMVTKIDLERIALETGEGVGEQTPGDISKPFQGFQRESISYVRTEEMDGKEVYVFQGKPEKSALQKMPFGYAKIETWIGADDGLLRKMIMFDQEGKEMLSQSYTNIEVNIEIADSQFEFTPPEGAQIMDMTERVINMMKQVGE